MGEPETRRPRGGHLVIVAIAMLSAIQGCSDRATPSRAEAIRQATKCVTPGTKEKAPYLPAPSMTLEKCFKAAMAEESGRRFLLGAGNAALADWSIRYAAELGARIDASERLPSQEVAAEPSIGQGVAQIVELYRALVEGLKAHLEPVDAARELRKALGLVAYQTAIALRSPGKVDLAAVGASYLTAEIVTRMDRQVEDRNRMVEPEFQNLMRNARFDLELGLVVALWHDEKVRAFLGRQGLPPPPVNAPNGVTIAPPLEGPDHVLQVPGVHDPAYPAFSNWWFHGPHPGTHDDALLVAVTEATELTGLRESFQGFDSLLRNKS